MAEPWFGRKRIGWGWSPRGWLGWTATTAFVVGVAGCGVLADKMS